MSEKCTTINLPNSEWPGLLQYDEQSAAEMINAAKAHAERELKLCQQVLDAKPEDFEIEVVRGVHVQRHIKWLQQSGECTDRASAGQQTTEKP